MATKAIAESRDALIDACNQKIGYALRRTKPNHPEHHIRDWTAVAESLMNWGLQLTGQKKIQ